MDAEHHGARTALERRHLLSSLLSLLLCLLLHEHRLKPPLSQALGQHAPRARRLLRCRGGGRTCRARVGYRSAHTTSRIRVGVGQTERTACVAAAIEQALRAGIERENKAGVMEKKRKKGGVTPSPPRVSLRGVLQTDEPITHPHLAYPPAYNTP
ncbi:hypothetical protein B0H13DRAFT_1888141 [Mycena leptocephala]|nr:hypothetical protein B0H13DRAFT_1899145 [Mycena leptocephala]KAJ7889212.1 hypothetical protein B0H13DRAFT_1888141 [Mycena leptocephala]